MSDKNNNPIEQGSFERIVAYGGIHIGQGFLRSYQKSIPGCRIEVYEDRIVLKLEYVSNLWLKILNFFGRHPLPFIGPFKEIPKELQLKYDEIKGYKVKDLKILGHGITFVHTNDQYAPFIQIWLWKKDAKLIID